ncbi:alpha,alpha-trehalase nth1 [Dimargaris xerosporica]|nr:alpha,alpha-trehalase nth1 [Dimargaris xerosporica]
MELRKRKAPMSQAGENPATAKRPAPRAPKARTRRNPPIDPHPVPIPNAPQAIQEPGAKTPNEPAQWREVYERIKDFRTTHRAPVDTMGCERLAETDVEPRVFRFQTLVSLMLSSMTKDATTAQAMRNLQALELTVDTMLATPVEIIDNCICKVGFHKKKAIFIKQVAQICRDQYEDDIPRTIEGLVALPGVGPKMAYLTMNCAWKESTGIGVDVHVNRISHRLGWADAKATTPELTRLQIEHWLPESYWIEFNPLLVGFGQILCTGLNPKCGECPVNDLCPSAFKASSRK